jgi:hypothetical protein
MLAPVGFQAARHAASRAAWDDRVPAAWPRNFCSTKNAGCYESCRNRSKKGTDEARTRMKAGKRQGNAVSSSRASDSASETGNQSRCRGPWAPPPRGHGAAAWRSNTGRESRNVGYRKSCRTPLQTNLIKTAEKVVCLTILPRRRRFTGCMVRKWQKRGTAPARTAVEASRTHGSSRPMARLALGYLPLRRTLLICTALPRPVNATSVM